MYIFKLAKNYTCLRNVSTNFMRTRITSYLILLLTSNLAIGQTSYEKEVKQFLTDILAESYTYNLQNYYNDSLELSKTDPLDFEYSFLKNHIDTSKSKYMLRTENGKMHFDTLLFVKEPDNFYYDNETQQLLKFLSKDSIFDVSNPFNQQTIEKCIKAYMLHKAMTFDDFVTANFVSKKELE